MRPILPILFIAALASCVQKHHAKPGYPEHVGDISFDPTIDDPGFVVCNEKKIYQYYNGGRGLQYEGEKVMIDEHFKEERNVSEQKKQSGFLTIRFIVNCKGMPGRFRVQGMDTNYNEKEFDEDIVDRYLAHVQKMEGWIPGQDGSEKFDYYQYLTFKLDNGRLIEIMP